MRSVTRSEVLRRGFDPDRLSRAASYCRRAVDAGAVPGCALLVLRHGRRVVDEAWGEAAPDQPASPETIWLIASLTKPVVCAAACLFVERGLLALDDPIRRWVPEFEDRRDATVLHLLTHTSGLPDMLPENQELRERHAPLPEFVRRACVTPLLFRPGSRISYQSMGIALVGRIIEAASGLSCPEFLRREVFEPLAMADSSLGWTEVETARLARYPPSEGQPTADWDWNSRYWRGFAAPWGGMFATTADYARFLLAFAPGKTGGSPRLLSPPMTPEIRANQTGRLPGLPEGERLRQSWGLGFRTAHARGSEYLGDLLSPEAYGHAGSTGTGAWHDPGSGVTFVYMSNRPQSGRHIGLLSNLIAAAAL